MFQEIDRSTWKREEYFHHYAESVPCTYSMTTKVDITNLRNRKVRLYPATLFLLTKLVNRHQEFRTGHSHEGVLGVFDTMNPTYTVFHPENETFSCLWTQWSPSYPEFLQNYQEDQRQYGNNLGMIGKPDCPDNVFNVSMIPWHSFDSFQLNLQKGYDYFLPIFTMGKFYEESGRTLLPLSVQVHHAVCDGFHVCRFLEELQTELQTFSEK